MAGIRNKWAITFGVLLALLLLITLFEISTIAVSTWQPLQQADKANQQLEARFGAVGSYTPPADGALAPARIEAFLQVQRELVADCERYQPIGRAFDFINELEGSEEPDARGVWQTMRLTFNVSRKITPFVGQFFENRNLALLNAGLSLDEYSYLYVSAYRQQLASA